MKNKQVMYNLMINLEKNEQLLNKVILHITDEKLLKKLIELLNDYIILNNKINKYLKKDYTDDRVDKEKIKEKYEEYKNIMSFL